MRCSSYSSTEFVSSGGANRMKTNSKKRRNSRRTPLKPKTKILIVDNDQAVASLLQDYLESEKGFTVLEAETGVDGIRAAVENVPDLILLGSRLGDMSGLEVHDRLCENPVTKKIPVIYVLSFLPLRTIEQAIRKGARGFISKPFNLSEISAKVESVLRSP